jgi:SAM-dependent methyltransferase
MGVKRMPYERQFASLYDRLMADAPYAQWIRFARQCWDVYGKPETVVDLGCGTGNIAIPLAQTGLNVFGVDLSENMLAIAADKTEQLRRNSAFVPGGSVVWLNQDMREWDVGRTVDSVISFCDSLNYLTEEDDIARTFRRTFERLRPGGTFLFDVHTPNQVRAYARLQPFVMREEDIAYIWTCELDEDRCEIEHELSIFVKADSGYADGLASKTGSTGAYGRFPAYLRVDEVHVQRAYELGWLGDKLREAGFADVECFADFSQKPPNADTERAFFVAAKR